MTGMPPAMDGGAVHGDASPTTNICVPISQLCRKVGTYVLTAGYINSLPRHVVSYPQPPEPATDWTRVGGWAPSEYHRRRQYASGFQCKYTILCCNAGVNRVYSHDGRAEH